MNSLNKNNGLGLKVRHKWLNIQNYKCLHKKKGGGKAINCKFNWDLNVQKNSNKILKISIFIGLSPNELKYEVKICVGVLYTLLSSD